MFETLFFACLIWGLFVGTIFSTIGAAGGILTSFGLITLFGVAEPNSVKPMTQLVVLASVLTFIPGYFRKSALVLPLGLVLGLGGLIGAYVGSTLSTFYLSDMKTFRPLFGIMTLAIAAQIVWKLLSTRHANHGSGSEPEEIETVSNTSVSLRNISFLSGTEEHNVPTWSPFVAGALISTTASIFGVGGGFLLVPYMVSVLKMPMHIIPATAAIAIFMSLSVSIANFLALGAPVDFNLLIPLGIGTVLGAIVGPSINGRMKNSWLHGAMAIIVAGIGIKYVFF